jgi:crotonobetainyl-CoA:carnitine CoA-transferase CaiB-like acyl-CoA transferase
MPQYPPGSLSDVITGTNLASGVLAALVQRAHTGVGCKVETSQLQSLLWTQVLPVSLMASFGERVERFTQGPEDNPVLRSYFTSDGVIALAAIHDEQWLKLLRVLDLSHLGLDERFASLTSIMEHREAISEELQKRLSTRSTAEWAQLFRQEGVWHAPVNRLEDLPEDPQIDANSFLVDFPDGTRGPALPYTVGDWGGARSAPAEYGEDTNAILEELGIDEDEILQLRIKGAIW